MRQAPGVNASAGTLLRGLSSRIAALLLASCLGTAAAAQDGTPAPSSPGHPYTLHVYQDLVQIPSLVLDASRQSVAGLRERDFNLRLDSGPVFHPTHARVEGDQRIDLLLLLDSREDRKNRRLAELDRQIAALPPGLLRPVDTVSVYAMDCELVGVSGLHGSVTSLQAGVGAVLNSPQLHSSAGHRCPHKGAVGLWDAMAVSGMRLRDVPGWRTLLVLSDGRDETSRNRWIDVFRYLADYSIAVFGIRPTPTASPKLPIGMTSPFAASRRSASQGNSGVEDAFGIVCASSGGLLSIAAPQERGREMERLLRLVRSRYILEFPRPANEAIGLHHLETTVDVPSAVVYTSGIGLPAIDRTPAASGTTVPTDASRRPVLGDRRPMAQPAH